MFFKVWLIDIWLINYHFLTIRWQSYDIFTYYARKILKIFVLPYHFFLKWHKILFFYEKECGKCGEKLRRT